MEKELREIFNKNNVGFGEIDVDNAVKDILRLFSVSNSANTDDYTKGYRDGWRDCHKDQKELAAF